MTEQQTASGIVTELSRVKTVLCCTYSDVVQTRLTLERVAMCSLSVHKLIQQDPSIGLGCRVSVEKSRARPAPIRCQYPID